jgi:hypothetical protein
VWLSDFLPKADPPLAEKFEQGFILKDKPCPYMLLPLKNEFSKTP